MALKLPGDYSSHLFEYQACAGCSQCGWTGGLSSLEFSVAQIGPSLANAN